MHRRVLSALVALALLALAAPMASVQARPKAPDTKNGSFVGVRDVGYLHNRSLPLAGNSRVVARRLNAPKPVSSAKIGDNRTWLALDDQQGGLYLKKYKLRGERAHIQVWTATGKSDVCDGDPETPCPTDENAVTTGLNFLPGDCRNGVRTQISTAQVKYFMGQFETKMYPPESQAFSVPPRRNGKSAILPQLTGQPKNYYQGGKGHADDIVVLLDNVRDDNFYDVDNQGNKTYIAGFFSSTFDDLLDRNVMSIDAYDWLHRTKANPPNEPDPNDLCKTAPGRPFLYEGVFAHEYQHLLESYEDPDEFNWVNEGLSDWAQSLTGYVDVTKPITDIDFDSHVQCFLGNLETQTEANPNPRKGGAENGLTPWGDQTDDEILCDYGAAYSIMLMLADRYGTDFMTALHRDDANGMAGLQNVLDAMAPGTNADDVVHEWIALMALDHVLDDGAAFTGGTAADYRSASLDAAIAWDNDDSYSSPGAPPNGADYVRLRNGAGAYLGAANIDSISFNGGPSLAPEPVEWTVDQDPPDHAANPALASGSGPNFDRSIVKAVKVPNGSSPNDPATLTFDTYFSSEVLWDYPFVQVSEDGGATWTSLSNTHTTSEHDPGADPRVVQELPGFTGDSGCTLENTAQLGGACSPTWVSETFDLTPYANKDVLLAFRYITDAGVDLPGWWIDNVMVGKENLTDGSTLTGWQTITQAHPVTVAGFTVQLLSYTDDHTVAMLGTIPLNSDFDGTLSGPALDAVIGTTAQTVAALVTYDDPSELQFKYAPYVLQVDGVTQPGGS
jgi:hypothetical protein